MLKYRCLVLDHDDTVVQSEKTIGYPFFREIIHKFRPGTDITLEEYLTGCHQLGFANMCRETYRFTEAELLEEFLGWKAYVRTHIPETFPGIERIIRRQKEAGGLLCVVSHSGEENISRDYRVHFGLQPDAIYGWDLPEDKRKPSPYALEDIMAKFGVSKEEILVVDDMKLAWDMANKVGVQTAFAAWGKLDFPALCQEMEALCDYTFQTTAELEAFLFEDCTERKVCIRMYNDMNSKQDNAVTLDDSALDQVSGGTSEIPITVLPGGGLSTIVRPSEVLDDTNTVPNEPKVNCEANNMVGAIMV